MNRNFFRSILFLFGFSVLVFTGCDVTNNISVTGAPVVEERPDAPKPEEGGDSCKYLTKDICKK